MNPLSNRLHLIVPGLLGPLDGLADSELNSSTLVLDRLLARADRIEAKGDYISILFGLFGYHGSPGTDWPSAAVCRLADGGTADQAYWLHAEPVFLKPDMDRLLLSDARALDIGPDEAAELTRLIEQHFAEEGWRLETATAQHWYMRLTRPPALATSPLHEAVGRNIFPFLPRGANASRWRGLLNEIQMLLHHADVNQRRREAGRLEINGVWLWGGGRVPVLPQGIVSQVFSDHPLAVGLARLAGVRTDPLTLDSEKLRRDGESVVFHEELLYPVLDVDAQSWCERLERLMPLMETLVDAVRRRGIDELLLYPCNGHCYRVTCSGLRRFWRRSKPVATQLASHS